MEINTKRTKLNGLIALEKIRRTLHKCRCQRCGHIYYLYFQIHAGEKNHNVGYRCQGCGETLRISRSGKGEPHLLDTGELRFSNCQSDLRPGFVRRSYRDED